MTVLIGAVPKGIPFIRQHPDGSLTGERVERPTQIEVLAGSVIARGGRFMIALNLDTDEVCIASIIAGADGEPVEISRDVVPNGLQLLFAIDRLVTESAALLDMVQ